MLTSIYLFRITQTLTTITSITVLRIFPYNIIAWEGVKICKQTEQTRIERLQIKTAPISHLMNRRERFRSNATIQSIFHLVQIGSSRPLVCSWNTQLHVHRLTQWQFPLLIYFVWVFRSGSISISSSSAFLERLSAYSISQFTDAVFLDSPGIFLYISFLTSSQLFKF